MFFKPIISLIKNLFQWELTFQLDINLVIVDQREKKQHAEKSQTKSLLHKRSNNLQENYYENYNIVIILIETSQFNKLIITILNISK